MIMDKKYRLKNWYPSLPITVEEGTVVTYVDQSYGGVYLTKQGKKIPQHEVENFPHFWERFIDHVLVANNGEEIPVYSDRTVYVPTPDGNILIMGSEEAYKADPTNVFTTFADANNWVQKSVPRYSINTIREWTEDLFPDLPDTTTHTLIDRMIEDLNKIQNRS